MSATFNTSQFGEYFGIPIQGRLQPPPVVNIDGRLFDVKEYYTDDLHEIYEVRICIFVSFIKGACVSLHKLHMHLQLFTRFILRYYYCPVLVQNLVKNLYLMQMSMISCGVFKVT